MPNSLQIICSRLIRLTQQLRLKVPEQEQPELLSRILESENLFLCPDDIAVVLKTSKENDSICVEFNESELFEHALWVFCSHHLLKTLESCISSNIEFRLKTLTDVSIVSSASQIDLELKFSEFALQWSFSEQNSSELEELLLTLGLGHSVKQAKQLISSYYKRIVLGKPVRLLYYRTESEPSKPFALFKKLGESEQELLESFQNAVENDLVHDFCPHSSKIFFEQILSSEEGLL